MAAGGGRFGPVVGLVERMVESEGLAGAGVAVAVGGQTAVEHYAGVAAPGLASGPEVVWPVASISKLYTAAAIAALVERGELTLGTRVTTILPRFNGGGKERVTLRHLLTHQGGLIYESEDMAGLLAAQTPLAEIVDEVYERPLAYAPGTEQRYSDLGYALAGRMAAVAMQADFPDLVRELVLEPVGLGETFMPAPAEEGGRVAYVAGATGEGTAGAMYTSAYGRALAHPAFGVYATLGDLLRFGLLFTPHAATRPLSAATVRAMTSDQTGLDWPGERSETPAGAIHAWGLGFAIKGRGAMPELVSPGSFGHQGASGCILWVDPEADAVIAYVSNRHLNTGLDAWMARLDRVVNVAMGCVSR